MKIDHFIGRPLDGLSLAERWRIAGAWVALEMYSPRTLPVRVIEAIGPSPQACAKQLRERGLDPAHFEFCACPQPYQP